MPTNWTILSPIPTNWRTTGTVGTPVGLALGITREILTTGEAATNWTTGSSSATNWNNDLTASHYRRISQSGTFVRTSQGGIIRGSQ